MTKKTTIRVKKQPGQFATIHKGFLADARLGLDAMGLLAWMLARPDDWKHHIGHIATSTGTPYNRARSSMQRLEECGYVLRTRVTDRKTGRVLRWEMTVFETPQLAATAKTEQPLLFEAFDTPKVGRKAGATTDKPRFQRNTPDDDFPGGGLPESGYPHGGNPDSGECDLLKTNVTKNDFTKQRRTNEQPPAIVPAMPPASDRLPASAGGSGDRVAAPRPSPSAGADGESGVVVVDSGKDIVASLVEKACFPAAEARQLVNRHGEDACRRALCCLAGVKSVPGNRRGFVVSAIQQGWQPGTARPSSGAGDCAPPAKSAAEVEAERRRIEAQLEKDRQRDGTLNRLNDADWAEHVSRLRPRLGPTVQKMLQAGRPAKTISTVRDLVYEDLTRRVAI